MRYPILTTSDASLFLTSRREGQPIEIERLAKARGEGPDMPQDFIAGLQADLASLKTRFPEGVKNPDLAGKFEAAAARLTHRRVQVDVQVLSDPDFWLWLAVAHFSDIVEWRYGSPEGGTKLANYGIGSRLENLIYRLWLRAELVLDEVAPDRYHLCDRGQIDFYRSHLFRPGYGNARVFARALLRFQYPFEDVAQPRLKLLQIRNLAKRLSRLRSNLFMEILDEDESLKVIQEEACRVPAAA